MVTRPSRRSRQAVALAALLAAGLAACGGTEGVAPTSPDAPGAAGAEAIPTPPAEESPPPLTEKEQEFKKKLDQARSAKEAEKARPNGRTVCLKSDGTLAGQIFHTRPEGAPPIEDSDKERICKENYKDAKWKGNEK